MESEHEICDTFPNVTHSKSKRSIHISVSRQNRKVFDIIRIIESKGMNVSDALCQHIIQNHERIIEEIKSERMEQMLDQESVDVLQDQLNKRVESLE